MIIKPIWIIEGIVDTITSAVILLIITNTSSALSQLDPIVKYLLDMASNILEFSGAFYLLRVATKKSWIVKEAIYSFGILLAAIAINDFTSMMIAFTTITIVLLRKIH